MMFLLNIIHCDTKGNDLISFIISGDEYSLFSSLNSKKGIVKDLHICTGRDKLVTVFDKNVYQSDKDTLSGKLIYSADNQILHAGGTDDTLILAEGTFIGYVLVMAMIVYYCTFQITERERERERERYDSTPSLWSK